MPLARALAERGSLPANGSLPASTRRPEDSNNEVQEALTAEQRATDPSVHGYAHLLVSDHSTLLSELSAIEPNQNNGNNSANTNNSRTIASCRNSRQAAEGDEQRASLTQAVQNSASSSSIASGSSTAAVIHSTRSGHCRTCAE